MVKQIEVLGLGAGDLEQLPVGVYKKLKQTNRLFCVQKSILSSLSWKTKA